MRELYATAGNWVFEPTAAQIRRTKKKNPAALLEDVDATGRKIFLIIERSVTCPSPEMGGDRYPESEKGDRWFVPRTDCEKCVHHQKIRMRNYVGCCWWSRKLADEAKAKS